MRGAFALSLLFVLGLTRVSGAQNAPGAASTGQPTHPPANGPAPKPVNAEPQPDHPAPVPAAQPYPAGSAAHAPDPGAPPAAPAPADDSGYRPTPPAQSATTHPQPGEYRVWRLVDPTEADWHAPDPNRPRGWFRVDVAPTGVSGYVGGSYRLADGLAFAPFAHVSSSTVVQPNLAVTWQLGGLWLMPAIGTSIDVGETRAVSLDPQLFAALDAKLIYLEAWAQYFVGSVYHKGTLNIFEARLMALVSICSSLGVGVEYDPSVATNSGSASAMLSSIFGGRTNVRIGDHDTMGLFLGYQGVAQARGAVEGISGRFEFVHQW